MSVHMEAVETQGMDSCLPIGLHLFKKLSCLLLQHPCSDPGPKLQPGENSVPGKLRAVEAR